MKTWKKILIAALSVLAISAVVFVSLQAYAHYKIFHAVSYWETQPQYVSENILMVYGEHGRQEFVRLKDVRTGKFTTPELQHIFINENNTEDSLVVFRTFDRLRGYLNVNTGKIVIPAQYNRAWNFSEGIAGVLKDGVVSFIKENGEPAFAPTFRIFYYDDYSEMAFQFHNGYCIMRTMDNKWGLINTQGKWVTEPIYTRIDKPCYGYRLVSDGDRFGLLTMDGQIALPVEYDMIRLASDRKGFIISKDGYAKAVDKQLNTILPFVHDGIYQLHYVDNYRDYEYDDEAAKAPEPKFWRYDIGEYSGVIDNEGHVIIPAKYHMVRMVNDHLFEVEITYEGNRVFFNDKGQYVGKCNF